MKPADIRKSLRPHGQIAINCVNCIHFADCGGIEPELGLFNNDCVMVNCCNPSGQGGVTNASECDNVCPNNPKYLGYLREVGGDLWFHKLQAITQSTVTLPRYIPLIYRRYLQKIEVDWPLVALDTYQVVKLQNGKMKTVADAPDSLRREFGLQQKTQVILRGVASDRPLERYWTYRRRDCIPQQLAELNIALAVGPNFSHFLDVPRHDNLFNRKRQLICLSEFTQAGLNNAPHLNAAQPGDWKYWGHFIGNHPSIAIVAVEFETGNRNRSQGQRLVAELAAIQQQVGRSLYPLVIGGTQFLEIFAKEFQAASFVDSTPFLKTVHRQAFVLANQTRRSRWVKHSTKQGEPLDTLLSNNVRSYSAWLEYRWNCETRDIAKVSRRKPLILAAG